MEISKNTLILKDSRGTEKEFRVLFTVSLKDINKNYIAFTDNKKDVEGNIKVNAAIYDVDKKDKLIMIEDENELELIDNIFKSIQFKIDEENR